MAKYANMPAEGEGEGGGAGAVAMGLQREAGMHSYGPDTRPEPYWKRETRLRQEARERKTQAMKASMSARSSARSSARGGASSRRRVLSPVRP